MKPITRRIAEGAVIAALYAVLSLISPAVSPGGVPFQFRFSEALVILPVYFPSAVPGLFVGCLISNILISASLPDVIFGSIATLIGAAGTLYTKDKPVLPYLCPVMANTVLLSPIIYLSYSKEYPLWAVFAMVLFEEALSVTVLGAILRRALDSSPIVRRK